MLKQKIAILVSLVILIAFFSFKTIISPKPYIFPNLSQFPKMPTSENTVTIEGVQLGRFLFYDSTLSKDYTVSCASCHKQAFAFSDSPNKFSKGIEGKNLNRNTMPLFNLAWYPTLFWDGRVSSIEEQVFQPVSAHNEMNLDWKTATKRIQDNPFYPTLFNKAFGTNIVDSNLISFAIAQFERTLISYNSKYDQVLRGEAYLSIDEYKGFELMNDQTKGDCLHCHTTDADALGTTTKLSNNGLSKSTTPEDYSDKGKATVTLKNNDIGLFKIPSLRNIEVTGPYMHNGKFNTLEEVIDFYSEGVNQSYNIDSKMEYAHQGGVHLNQTEKHQIIAFLKTLTDSTFLNNPEFSNPFSR